MCRPQTPATLAGSRTPGPSDPFCRVRGDEGSSLITVLVFIAIISTLVGVVLQSGRDVRLLCRPLSALRMPGRSVTEGTPAVEDDTGHALDGEANS